ncbi:MarR family winged helix-turn-helix transcriptional regulator [Kriegella aquimaris]|uniref:DNA-binding transcriptional regulator, MarR family n=1 Tax=Kriegella aquimaris TaxID=192904 RepID=A0A1G9K0C0_9FLAO|nr:MarR family transcriptional regulator [Kriegella aquimaris]SDL42936.1 DNA-binding transcriptional regulator, MarR family [Kriegella aquimaris]
MIEEILLFQIDKTSKVAKQYSQREFDRLGLNITVEQWILLKIVHESNHISQKELAEKSLRDPASITRTLDLLQKKELINRLPIPENRRQYNINLSKKGAAFVQKNMPIVDAHRKKSIEGLSEKDQQTLNNLLKRIQENMN